MAEAKANTQREMIMLYLKENGSITALDAMRDLGVLQLAARVAEIRERGVDIITELEGGRNRYGKKIRYARYRLRE